MLKQISEKFSSRKKQKLEAVEPSMPCTGCHGSDWWMPPSGDSWRCYECTPPPSVAFVSRRSRGRILSDPRKPGRHIEDQRIATYCVPWCDACNCRHAIRTMWSDGEEIFFCRCCGKILSEKPRVFLKK